MTLTITDVFCSTVPALFPCQEVSMAGVRQRDIVAAVWGEAAAAIAELQPIDDEASRFWVPSC